MEIRWRHCRAAEAEHRDKLRQYAHTFHYQDTICLAKAFWELPPEYRDGILLHEIGHLLAGPEASEQEATEAAEEFFDTQIRYVDSEYGRRLERLKKRPRKVRRRKNPDNELPYDEWVPAHAVRFNDDGTVSLMTEPQRLENVTDRALRYRANAEPPPGERICAFCGSRRFVEVGHIDGHEENTEPRNLIWNCRSCNTQMGMEFKRRGIGRRTHQYNPSGGAQTLGAWIAAVLSMRGESGQMKLSDAVALIHATPHSRRSEFAKELYALGRKKGTRPPKGGWEVPF